MTDNQKHCPLNQGRHNKISKYLVVQSLQTPINVIKISQPENTHTSSADWAQYVFLTLYESLILQFIQN